MIGVAPRTCELSHEHSNRGDILILRVRETRPRAGGTDISSMKALRRREGRGQSSVFVRGIVFVCLNVPFTG
jgi:hypothetical protein